MTQSCLASTATRRILALVATAGLLATAAGTLNAQTAAVNATLVWTAPGDDAVLGRASRYDIRYSSNAISGTDTVSWWNAATIVNTIGKVPVPAGQTDSMVVTNLTSGVRYYAIVRTGDEVPNWSGYSNVAVIDLRDMTPPARVADLRTR